MLLDLLNGMFSFTLFADLDDPSIPIAVFQHASYENFVPKVICVNNTKTKAITDAMSTHGHTDQMNIRMLLLKHPH